MRADASNSLHLAASRPGTMPLHPGGRAGSRPEIGVDRQSRRVAHPCLLPPQWQAPLRYAAGSGARRPDHHRLRQHMPVDAESPGLHSPVALRSHTGSKSSSDLSIGAAHCAGRRICRADERPANPAQTRTARSAIPLTTPSSHFRHIPFLSRDPWGV